MLSCLPGRSAPLLRLAYRHTGQGLRRLLADLRINGVDFEAGEPDALLAFAEAIGAEPQVLSQNTIRRLKRYNRFRGEDFSRSFLSGRVVQFCSIVLSSRVAGATGIARSFGHSPRCRFVRAMRVL